MENNEIWRRFKPKTDDEVKLKKVYELVKAKSLTSEDIKLLLECFELIEIKD